MKTTEIRPQIVGSNTQDTLSEALVEPFNEKVTKKKFIACHVPEEQWLPELKWTPALSELDQNPIPTLRVETSMQNLADVDEPTRTLRAHRVRSPHDIEIPLW